MRLDTTARRLYVRQILLGEIGEAGQARLFAAAFRPGAECDADAYAVAREYLLRAGCPEDERAGTPLDEATEATVTRLAGDPSLRPAAAAVLGALLAVQHIKRALDLPTSPMKRGLSPFSKG